MRALSTNARTPPRGAHVGLAYRIVTDRKTPSKWHIRTLHRYRIVMRCSGIANDARTRELGTKPKNEKRKTNHCDAKEAHPRTALIKATTNLSRPRYASLATRGRDQQRPTRITDGAMNPKSFLARLTVGASSEGGLSTTRLRHFASAWTSVPRNGLDCCVHRVMRR